MPERMSDERLTEIEAFISRGPAPPWDLELLTEVRRLRQDLDWIRAAGEPIPDDDLRAIEKLSGRKLGVPYYCPEAFGVKEGL